MFPCKVHDGPKPHHLVRSVIQARVFFPSWAIKGKISLLVGLGSKMVREALTVYGRCLVCSSIITLAAALGPLSSETHSARHDLPYNFMAK